MYAIRCEALNFKLSKSQKKVIKRVNRYLITGQKPGAADADADADDSSMQTAAEGPGGDSFVPRKESKLSLSASDLKNDRTVSKSATESEKKKAKVVAPYPAGAAESLGSLKKGVGVDAPEKGVRGVEKGVGKKAAPSKSAPTLGMQCVLFVCFCEVLLLFFRSLVFGSLCVRVCVCVLFCLFSCYFMFVCFVSYVCYTFIKELLFI